MSQEPKAATEQEWLEFRDRLEGKYAAARDALRARVEGWPPVPGMNNSDAYWFRHVWDNRVGEAQVPVMRAVIKKEIAKDDLPKYVAHHILLDQRPMKISPQDTPYLDFPGEGSVGIIERFLDDFVVFANSLVHEKDMEYSPKTVAAARRGQPPAKPQAG